MKKLCPLCSSTLLRHLHQRKIAWFCTSCRQEMPNFNVDHLNAIYRNFLKTKINQNEQKILDNQYSVMSYSSINHSSIAEDITVKIGS